MGKASWSHDLLKRRRENKKIIKCPVTTLREVVVECVV
jgi:hypothetical protein